MVVQFKLRIVYVWLILSLIGGGAFAQQSSGAEASKRTRTSNTRLTRSRRTEPVKVVSLPNAKTVGTMSVEQAFAEQAKFYQMQATPLDNSQISQLAWSAQMKTKTEAIAAASQRRATIAADPRQNMQLFFITNTGIYAYKPDQHQLEEISMGDRRLELVTMTVNPMGVGAVGCGMVITGPSRAAGSRETMLMKRLLMLETGRIAQSLHLQAASQQLATASFDTFQTENIQRLLQLPRNSEPYYVLFVGNRTGVAIDPTKPLTEQSFKNRTKRVALLVSPVGFNDTELLGVLGVLNDAGIESFTVSVSPGIVTSQSGQQGQALLAIEQIKVKQIDAVVVIGGPGATTLSSIPQVQSLLKRCFNAGKIVAATGKGALVLGATGILQGIPVATDSDNQALLQQVGANVTGNKIETHETVITARGQDGAIPLGRALTNVLARQ